MLRILDLFCGAGLVADGLRLAGFVVVGVDLHPQPRYPGPFLQADATRLDVRFLGDFDAVWASPPCLRDTAMRHAPGAKGEDHPELIPATRRLLRASGLPYVIENVEGAALVDPVVLCGSMFGLGVTDGGARYHLQRHRKFETNWPLSAPGPCAHAKPVVGVYGGHARRRAASAGGRGTRDEWEGGHQRAMADAMGLRRRLTCAEISQGIPPAYAAWVGGQLAEHVWLQRYERGVAQAQGRAA
jgi:DNA (cytosine-5)-methyltransferase 1